MVATLPMSAVMLTARGAGFMRARQPPEAIVDEAAHAAGGDPPLGTVRFAAVVAHMGFGAASGAVFGFLVRGAPVVRVAEGVAFGLLVWQVSYRGWIPSAGILPSADVDEPGRRATMLGAHVVYGATLGAVLARR